MFFLAYHLHWSWSELMAHGLATSGARTSRLLVEQIERENAQIEQSRTE